MLAFSRDVDILRYEPVLFGDLHFPSQVLCSGSGGNLNGTVFTDSSADFTGANVEAGGVIYLRSSDGQIDGSYEIVSVDSQTQLTISVLRKDGSEDAVSPGSAEAVSYRISTFAPQASEVLFELTQCFGIRPGKPDSMYDIDNIVDVDVLRQVSVYAVLAGVFSTFALGDETDTDFWKKTYHYQQLYSKARERCQISIDINDDEIGERLNVGGSIRLVRD